MVLTYVMVVEHSSGNFEYIACMVYEIYFRDKILKESCRCPPSKSETSYFRFNFIAHCEFELRMNTVDLSCSHGWNCHDCDTSLSQYSSLAISGHMRCFAKLRAHYSDGCSASMEIFALSERLLSLLEHESWSRISSNYNIPFTL